GVWGRRPVAWRGRAVAALSGATTLTIEDGFLRSVHPAGAGDQALSLCLDDLGIYFDASKPSRLETMITEMGNDPETMARARAGMEHLRTNGLSKYTPQTRGSAPLPDPGFVLIIDQTRGDASIAGAGVDESAFRAMLDTARAEHPDKPLVFRSHPDTRVSSKRGYFTPSDARQGDFFLEHAANPWDVLERAAAVYTVSSQMGFEALIAGKPVNCFGRSFYSGWGLTNDRLPAVRPRSLKSLEQIFAAAYFDYCVYYDPFSDQLVSFEDAAELLVGQVRWRGLDHSAASLVFSGFRSWKRKHCLLFAPAYKAKALFFNEENQAIEKALTTGSKVWFWASKASDDVLDKARHAGVVAAKVEDGFIRSSGLGAALVAPASLVFDDLGIYYDPTRQSRLEVLIAEASAFPEGDERLQRAAELRESIVQLGLTKYNVGRKTSLKAPAGQRVILVPGQVEDDASVRLGAPGISTNLDLLRAAREANPDAWIVYKPHPDVEAGLRSGSVPEEDQRALSNEVAPTASAADLIRQADEIWTMTSLMGFEGLMRGKQVTCLGIPFYAGWGLTQDQVSCERRQHTPGLDALVWACLIAYPRYVDPVTRLPCEPEVVVSRLASGKGGPTPRLDRLLAKLQGWLAGHGLIFWR
ncbi:MAG: capsular polysaccharide biosynthesis protein, partial [Pseudomonadota bacterium]